MQDIIKEYGPAMITVVVIGAMLILVSTLIGKDQNSIVGGAFSQLLTYFFTKNALYGGRHE